MYVVFWGVGSAWPVFVTMQRADQDSARVVDLIQAMRDKTASLEQRPGVAVRYLWRVALMYLGARRRWPGTITEKKN